MHTWLIPQLRIERVLKEDSSNQRRHDLLQYLESQINERSEDFPEGTGMWIKEQTQTLLSTLKHPVEGEHALLVQLSVDNGGVEFFRKRYPLHLVLQVILTLAFLKPPTSSQVGTLVAFAPSISY